MHGEWVSDPIKLTKSLKFPVHDAPINVKFGVEELTANLIFHTKFYLDRLRGGEWGFVDYSPEDISPDDYSPDYSPGVASFEQFTQMLLIMLTRLE